MNANRDFLDAWLAAGPFRIGQVTVSSGYRVFHSADAGRDDLVVYRDPHAAVAIARSTAEGAYRPLKAAPDLRRGWLLQLDAADEVHRALDFLYPAALGTAREHAGKILRPVPLSVTLGRQTGMYAVTRTLSSDGARRVQTEVCGSGCLKEILWDRAARTPAAAGASGEETADIRVLPLLCAEACSLFVAHARNVVRATGAGKE